MTPRLGNYRKLLLTNYIKREKIIAYSNISVGIFNALVGQILTDLSTPAGAFKLCTYQQNYYK